MTVPATRRGGPRRAGRARPARPRRARGPSAGSSTRATPPCTRSVSLDGVEVPLRLQAGRGGAAAVGLPRRARWPAGRSPPTCCPRPAGWDVVPPTVLRGRPVRPGQRAVLGRGRRGSTPTATRWRRAGRRAGRRRPARTRCRRAGCGCSTPQDYDGQPGQPRPRRRRRPCAGWPSSTSSSTTPTARAGTCCATPGGAVYGVDHGVTFNARGQAAHGAVGLGRGAAARAPSARRCARLATRPRRGRPAARGAGRRCSTAEEVEPHRGDRARTPAAAAPGAHPAARSAGVAAGHPVAGRSEPIAG